MYQVTADTMISDILKNAPKSVPLFEEIGMHCMGCALASGENLAQACLAHGVSVDDFMTRLNRFITEIYQ